MTATHRKRDHGRPAGVRETCPSARPWGRFLRCRGLPGAGRDLLCPLLGSAEQRGAAAAAAAWAGRVGRRGPSHGRV